MREPNAEINMKVNLISTKPTDYVHKTLAYENATRILGDVTHHPGVVGHKIDITDESIVPNAATTGEF